MKKNAGFTLAEMLIVVMIILILATAAIGETTGILRNLRFGNAFNSIVLMVQEGRNLAATGKPRTGLASTAWYVVSFSITTDPQRIDINAVDNTGSNQDLPALNTKILDQNEGFQLLAHSDGQPCTNVFIRFATGSAAVELICLDQTFTPKSVSVLTVEIKDTKRTQSKSFTLHRASGIPQVE